MANAFTAGGSGAAWDNFVETAFNRRTDWYLRDRPQWRQLVDVRPTAQAMPGSVVTFSLQQELAHATSDLPETSDPDTVALPAPLRVNVTLTEKGNATLATEYLDALSFINANADVNQSIAFNQADSMDDLVRAVADAGTNIVWVNGGVITNAGTDVATVSTDLFQRKIAAAAPKFLERNKIMPKVGNSYLALIHPDVAFDLQAESTQTAWSAPHTLGGDTGPIYTGVTGQFSGAGYIETTRTKVATTGPSSQKVYNTYFLGAQALAGAEAVAPTIRLGGTVTDVYKRFRAVAWYALVGYAIYRQKALLTVRTQSSISTVTV